MYSKGKSNKSTNILYHEFLDEMPYKSLSWEKVNGRLGRGIVEDGFEAPKKEEPVQTTTPAPQVAQTAPTPVISVSEAEAKAFIYQHESGNNPGAINASSGACGLGQALPCSKMPCSLDDYNCQDQFFTQYMQNRYGSWANAMNFWQSKRWW